VTKDTWTEADWVEDFKVPLQPGDVVICDMVSYRYNVQVVNNPDFSDSVDGRIVADSWARSAWEEMGRRGRIWERDTNREWPRQYRERKDLYADS
jgi:hypothetical protein